MIANIIRNAKKTVTGGDPYYSAVSLLLPMDGTNGSTTFTDSGPNAIAVTAVGNTQISTTQSKYGGASGYFDGSGDYLDMSGTGIATAFGTGDFTIEFWYYPLSVSVQQNLVDKIGSASNAIYLSSAGVLKYYVAGDRITGATLSANTWYHIALVRYSGVTKLYVNGVQSGASYTDTNNYALNTGSPRIGAAFNNTVSVNGYIDDLRITKYARYTSAFTPPTSAHPNIYNPYTTLPVSGAALWLAGDDSSTLYTDAGTSAVTKSGDLVYQWTDKSGNSRNAIQTTSGNRPTWVAPANARNNLGAVAFNGTSQFLNLASDPIGTNDYTIEFWMKQEATTASYWVILDSRVSGNAIGYPVILYNNSSTALSFYNNGWLLSATVSVSTWTHVAITRSSGTIRMFVNGSIASSGTDTSSYNTFRQLGKAFDPYYFKGQIQNLIIYNGQALYTANFTPWMS
jgi:hypothetical protein